MTTRVATTVGVLLTLGGIIALPVIYGKAHEANMSFDGTQLGTRSSSYAGWYVVAIAAVAVGIMLWTASRRNTKDTADNAKNPRP